MIGQQVNNILRQLEKAHEIPKHQATEDRLPKGTPPIPRQRIHVLFWGCFTSVTARLYCGMDSVYFTMLLVVIRLLVYCPLPDRNISGRELLFISSFFLDRKTNRLEFQFSNGIGTCSPTQFHLLSFTYLDQKVAFRLLLKKNEEVPKYCRESCLERRCKCQSIPSKNCCISICASPLCSTSMATYQSFCPTIDRHLGVHPVF